MIQRVKTPIKFCWMSLAWGIIVIAVVLQIVKLSLPHIDYFNDNIAAYASRELSADVSLGRISAKWPGLRPLVMVEDLNVVSKNGQKLISLERASMQLNILASLFHWTPVWDSVQAEGVHVHVEQGASGAWTIGGLKPTRDDRSWRYRSPSALFLMAGDVQLSSSKVFFTLHNQRQIETNIPIISIQNNGHFHRLNARADIGENSAFDFILEGVGDPSIANQFFAQAYLKLNRFPVERLAQLLGQAAIGLDTQEDTPEAKSEANLSLWFDFASPSRFLMNGNIELVNEHSSRFAKKYYLDIPIAADIVGDYSIKKGLSVGLRDIRVDNTLQLEQAHILIHEKKIHTAIDQVNLRDWFRWSNKRLIRVDGFNRFFDELAPQGLLKNLYSTVDLSEPKKTFFNANIENVHTQAWRGLPELKGVSGYLESDYEEGFIVLDTNDFVFFPKAVYKQAISAKSATGKVTWLLDWQQQQVNVKGYDLTVRGDYGELNGFFSLDLGWEENTSHQNLTLQLGLQNSDALFHQQFVPKLLPQDILQWMSSSIKAGDVSQAGLFYRGGLEPDSERTIQFFADINKGELAFSTDWPALKNLNGRFFIEDDHVFGRVDQAAVYAGDVFSGHFSWNENKEKALKISAKGTSKATSGLRYLRESWLNTVTPSILDQFQAKGRVGVDVDLVIPLDDSKIQASQNLALEFKKNTVNWPALDLQFDAVNGVLYYASEKGFTAKQLKGVLFDENISASVGADPVLEDILNIKAQGSVDVKSLEAWLDKPVLSYTSGKSNYQIDIQIPLSSEKVSAEKVSVEKNQNQESVSRESRLLITSNLQGIKADLPQPFGKNAEQIWPFQFEMPLVEDRLEYKMTLASYLSAHFIRDENNITRATLALSDKQYPQLTTLPETGLKLVSQFNTIDLPQWVQLLKTYPRDQNQGFGEFDAFVSIDQLNVNENQFDNIMLSGHREQSGWSVFIDSDDVLGGIYIDDDRSRPLVMDIDYLHWPDNEKDDGSLSALSADSQVGNSDTEKQQSINDFMAQIDPRSLPAADIKINRLVYKDKPLGSWSMQLKPNEEGLKVDNIFATVNGFTLSGKEENQGATLSWQVARENIPASTRFDGIIFGDNPKVLFEQWGLPFGLESEETRLEANILWPGSPTAFQIDALEGTLINYHRDGIFIQDKANEMTGVLRLFGLFNFDSWARRVRLDFSDVYKKGLVFDEVKGQLRFKQGLIELSEPLTMTGPSSKMSLSGSIDYPSETVDARLIATIPVGGNLTVVAALAGGLPAAAGVYLVSKLFEKQVEKVSSINYIVKGNWNDPLVKVDKLDEQAVLSQTPPGEGS